MTSDEFKNLFQKNLEDNQTLANNISNQLKRN